MMAEFSVWHNDGTKEYLLSMKHKVALWSVCLCFQNLCVEILLHKVMPLGGGALGGA